MAGAACTFAAISFLGTRQSRSIDEDRDESGVASSSPVPTQEAVVDYRDYSEANSAILAASRLRECTDARLKEILEAAIQHAHAFVKDVSISEDEWLAGIKFLTAVGQKCDARRQEFVLLSDVLGVSSLVEMIAHRKPSGATPSTVLGPFHVANAPVIPFNGMLARGPQCAAMEKMAIGGRVLDTVGKPIAGAVVEVWHADNSGWYDIQPQSGVDSGDSDYRGKLVTREDGSFAFRSVMPRFYPIPNDGPVSATSDSGLPTVDSPRV